MTTSPDTRPCLRTIALYAIPVLYVVAVYWPSLSFDFVYDDDYFVVRNRAVHSWRYVPQYFVDLETYSAELHAPMYRPIRNISYLVDWTIAGPNPLWFHAHNMALHAVNACLVLWILHLVVQLVGGSRDRGAATLACLAGTLIWLAHPAHTEAIAWIKSRDELLFTLFYLAALGIWLKSIKDRAFSGWWRTAWILILGILSLLSKEMAVSLPFVVFAAGLYFAQRRDFPAVLRTSAALLGVTIVFVIVRHLVIGKTAQQGYLAGNWYAQALTMTRVAMRYVGLAVAPSGLTINYDDYGVSRSLADWRVLLSLAGIGALLGTIWCTRRRLPGVSFGMLWFVVTLMPVSNLIPTMQWLAERFLYLPLVGLAMGVASGLFQLQLRLSERMARAEPRQIHSHRHAVMMFVLVLAFIMALTAATCIRLPVWRNDLTLHESTWLDSPPSPRIIRNYAVALANRGHYEAAVPLFRQLLAEGANVPGQVDESSVHQGLGLALIMTGHVDEGVTHSLRALELHPDDVETMRHLVLGFRLQGHSKTALRYCDKALQLAPDDAWLKTERARMADALTSAAAGLRRSASTTVSLPIR